MAAPGLLNEIIDAHGGLELWRRYATVEADVVSGGALLDRKAPQGPETQRMTVSTQKQAASVTPFGSANRRTAFTADRIAVESLDGELLMERRDPESAFAGDDLDTPWDPLSRGYFNGYAMWSCLIAPFTFAMAGAEVAEVEPIQWEGETWRGISVVMPKSVATHSPHSDVLRGRGSASPPPGLYAGHCGRLQRRQLLHRYHRIPRDRASHEASRLHV